MAGRFLLDRSIFRYAEKPYTDFEAWVWLIASAKYSGPSRGTLLGGRDFLAKAWGWDASKVRKKLNKWEQEGRIIKTSIDFRTTVEDHLWDQGQGPPSRTTVVTVITIPKYDEYQKINGKPGPPSRTRVKDQSQDHRRGPYLNEEELTKRTKKSTVDPHPSGVPDDGHDESEKAIEPKNKKPDPRIKTLIDFFHNQYLETLGSKPHIIGKPEASAIKRLLRTFPDEEDLKNRIKRYIEDPLTWMDRPNHTLTGFEKAAQKYNQSDDWRI